ncbi:MAG: hypothetical protein IPM42_14470 [Saprospiraceae bacterium]|nr:hypothetical protein [Saprospiraceae bacterium]
MQIKTTFILLLAVYLISVISNSLKSNGNLGNALVPLILLGTLFLCYSALSIMMMIKLNKIGCFNWISTNPQIKNIVLIVGLFSVLYSVFTSLMIKADWPSYQNQSISNPLDFLAYTSYIWVPLLMIIPYGLLMFANDALVSPINIIKVSLFLNVLLGVSIFTYLNFGFVKVIFTKRESEQDYAINQTIVRIQNERKLMDVLYYTRPRNESKVVDSVLNKIKSDPTWEYQLIKALENCDQDESFHEIYHFMSVYKLDNPDKFVIPFGNSIECVAYQSNKIANNQYASPNDLDVLFIEKMLAAFSYQFSGEPKILIDKLSTLENTLRTISREDFKLKTQELISSIEIFKKEIG